MSVLKHIEHIGDTDANIRANLDTLQIAIQTDDEETLIWADEGADKYMYSAIQYSKNLAGAKTYRNNEFNRVTTRENIHCNEYLYRRTDIADYVRLENDKVTIGAGGIAALIVEDDQVYTSVVMGVGKAPDGGIDCHVYDSGTCILEIESNTDNAWLFLNSGTDGSAEVSGIQFQDNSNQTWTVWKDDSNDFAITDNTRGENSIHIVDNGDMTLMDVSGDVGINKTPDANIKLHVYDSTSCITEIEGAVNSHLYINSNTASGDVDISAIVLQDDSNDMWEIRKFSTTNHFEIYDSTRAAVSFEIEDNGDMILMETGGDVIMCQGTGDVGIGKASDANINLHVYASGASTVEIESNTTNAYLYINSNTDGLGAAISGIHFQDNSAGGWLTYKGADNHYYIDEVGIGTVLQIEDGGNFILTPTGNVNIDADNKYLDLGAGQGSGICDTGTYMLFDCDRQSATGRYFQFDNGYISIDDAASGTNPGMSIERSVTGGNAHGYQDYTGVNLNAAAGYASYDVRNTISGSNNMDHFNGCQSAQIYNNSGTMVKTASYASLPSIQQGTLTYLAHFRAQNVSVAGGTITTQYGLYILDALTAGTTNWAIYTAGATASYFGGAITTDGLLTVNDDATITNGTSTTLTVGNQTANSTNSFIDMQGKSAGGTALNMKWELTTGGRLTLDSQSLTDVLNISTTTGNVGLGTSTFQAAAVTNLAIKEGTAPGAATADQCYMWAQDDSGTAEMYVQDGGGNQTKISPHNKKKEWEFFSKNVKTGRTVKINMEKFIKDYDKRFKTNFFQETFN